MKKAALIVGARPQFIKTAPLILQMERYYEAVLIHAGQHYDFNMSETFFKELELPEPDYRLNIPDGSDGSRTARMIEGVESVLSFEKPDFTVVIGDTNCTMAGALSSAKLSIPVVHVEAGVRSKDRYLPEQINRVVTDSVSECLLCPTNSAVENLHSEGKTLNVFLTGDVIYDSLRMFEKIIPSRPDQGYAIPDDFVLATIHRAEAVDNSANLRSILASLGTASYPVVVPVHPRTAKMMRKFTAQIEIPGNLIVIDPVGYLDLLSLVRLCKFVVSDSGGIQREAVFLGKHVVVPRPETEWKELERSGWLNVVGYEFDLKNLSEAPSGRRPEDIMNPASGVMLEKLRELY